MHSMQIWNAKTMRRYQLPPLDLLEAFEAAARHLSFTRAADELSVTQSAISRQIKALEDALGVALFQRLHRALELTEAGQQLSIGTTTALQQLHGLTDKLRAQRSRKTVVVTTTPGFAGLWLIPRLAGFLALQPDVDVRISASHDVVDLDREGVDVAVRYGGKASAGARAVKLFGEAVMPVCSPSLRASVAHPLKRPEDLRHHTLLHFESAGKAPLVEWALWLRAMKLDDLQPASVLHFSLYDQMIHAAISGQGVALGRLPLIARLLKDGQLVAPFSNKVVSPLGYQLLLSAAAASKPQVLQFADWLRQEARAAGSARTRPKSL
jgi:LysR family glycine cleavage system transcriptional activator